jgi:hypothetical protein
MKQMIPLFNRWPGWWPVTAAALVVVLIAFSIPGFAAKGGIKGPPNDGGGEAGANKLSVPGVLTEGTDAGDDVTAFWIPPADGATLGVHYSYACDVIEEVDQFKYPNTSCVDDLSNPGEYLDAAACAAPGAPCDGLPVSRVFWQKVDENNWSADADGISASRDVAYVDWGDALEAVSWNERSVIRVETQPYSTQIPGFDPVVASCETAALDAGLDPSIACKVGLQMWHVSGQGTNEQWGVRATADGTDVSYNYDSPFEIINSDNVLLNLTKLVPEDAVCPNPGEGEEGELPPEGIDSWTGSEWAGTCTWYDDPYSVELSVGGKYVYGYNWRMKNVELDSACPGWNKLGYWRLTFYSPPIASVNFTNADAPNVAPPAIPSEVRELPRMVFNTALADPPPAPLPDPDAVLIVNGAPVVESDDPTVDDRLYKPEVDTANNLTYLDICITGKTKGGGGGGGKPGGGGGGGKP